MSFAKNAAAYIDDYDDEEEEGSSMRDTLRRLLVAGTLTAGALLGGKMVYDSLQPGGVLKGLVSKAMNRARSGGVGGSETHERTTAGNVLGGGATTYAGTALGGTLGAMASGEATDPKKAGPTKERVAVRDAVYKTLSSNARRPDPGERPAPPVPPKEGRRTGKGTKDQERARYAAENAKYLKDKADYDARVDAYNKGQGIHGALADALSDINAGQMRAEHANALTDALVNQDRKLFADTLRKMQGPGATITDSAIDDYMNRASLDTAVAGAVDVNNNYGGPAPLKADASAGRRVLRAVGDAGRRLNSPGSRNIAKKVKGGLYGAAAGTGLGIASNLYANWWSAPEEGESNWAWTAKEPKQ